ncbi:MAG: RidA family protein [Planctomycetes bacterium]|jgi:2-iminobutanoate/2-iminopropanoate deaminase|nr:RidA family protein [Planctomycetota bacterium]MCL4728884.1 RidA family protein [Planctomycetota bacterium]
MIVSTDQAPSFPTILSQARRAGNLLFTCGTVPMRPGSRELAAPDMETQTRVSLENLGHILRAGGANFDTCLKVTVYLTDMRDYGAMNAVYKQFFRPPMPARTCVGVKELALPGMKIEIEAVAEIRPAT